MFVLLNIEALPDDLLNLPEGMSHKTTLKAVFTIKDVPDTFTGTVYEDASGELQLGHFNNPKGNKRKVITLKNKLPTGGFEPVKQYMLAVSRGESVSYPLKIETPNKRISGTPRAEKNIAK